MGYYKQREYTEFGCHNDQSRFCTMSFYCSLRDARNNHSNKLPEKPILMKVSLLVIFVLISVAEPRRGRNISKRKKITMIRFCF